MKVQQVSQDLGVRYVLEGSVRKVAERVRITAQLIDATTGAHLWAERYDRVFEDVFTVQVAAAELLKRDPVFSLERYAALQPYQNPAALTQELDILRQGGLQ